MPDEPLFPLKVFYDGACPVCLSQAARYRAMDREGRQEFIDITRTGFDADKYGRTKDELWPARTWWKQKCVSIYKPGSLNKDMAILPGVFDVQAAINSRRNAAYQVHRKAVLQFFARHNPPKLFS